MMKTILTAAALAAWLVTPAFAEQPNGKLEGSMGADPLDIDMGGAKSDEAAGSSRDIPGAIQEEGIAEKNIQGPGTDNLDAQDLQVNTGEAPAAELPAAQGEEPSLEEATQ